MGEVISSIGPTSVGEREAFELHGPEEELCVARQLVSLTEIAPIKDNSALALNPFRKLDLVSLGLIFKKDLGT